MTLLVLLFPILFFFQGKNEVTLIYSDYSYDQIKVREELLYSSLGAYLQ